LVFKIVKVVGDSMSPTLNDGDYVLIKKPRQFMPGLIYVINHCDLGRIIKRMDTTDNGRYRFKGDNPSSTPASLLGLVDANRITARVTHKITAFGIKRVS